MAITGASGVVYAARLLQELLSRQCPVHLTVSESGRAVVGQELDVDLPMDGSDLAKFMTAADHLLGVDADDPTSACQVQEAVRGGCLTFHHYKNYFTPIASGSFLTRGMVICPCSGATLSGIAHASSTNLIQRAAEVHLKEHRKLIVVPRETPLSLFQLENMQRLAQAGAIVLPASPGWYHGATCLRDLVDFIVARILDQLGIDNATIQRWEAGPVGDE
jgi:4-hydroxy-3-polyprenylbenzoate decarboxylase